MPRTKFNRKYTEKSIQSIFFDNFVRDNRAHPKFRFCCPNITTSGGEADLIAVRPSGFVEEFEIKISRSDFKHDAKKRWKHVSYGERLNGSYNWPVNRFWYLVPKDLVSVEEVPEYAGLMYVNGDTITIEKWPVDLHKNKKEWWEKAAVSLMWKHFNKLSKEVRRKK